MKLTTKGRYAVTAMIDLALHADEGPVALADISCRQGISLSYLEQLFGRLRKQGLVNSTRGPGGGYTLKDHPSDVSISNVIDAVDESVDTTSCGGTGSCQGDIQCLTHDLWVDLSNQIRSFLNGITLQDMLDSKTVQSLSEQRDVIALQRIDLESSLVR